MLDAIIVRLIPISDGLILTFTTFYYTLYGIYQPHRPNSQTTRLAVDLHQNSRMQNQLSPLNQRLFSQDAALHPPLLREQP